MGLPHGGAGYSVSMAVNPIQVQKFLKGIDYPATKDEVVKAAQSQGADDNVLDTLRNLPRDNFNSPNDISEAMGQQSG
ncbi:DUF2795 domain-containing protein [Streptoalloteichus tenebrarius]|nr:DUF2795 domain-containing protein [Streptoalloteichus tenebrarius]